eukprot:TRINITY_DN2434_c0_g1_i10.p1 TRINITY_DN2434_c0_g1~~TRINITY_DN2434_c0_g1_i10.p1  ORF type:complete len:323 (-),score=69.81 TRINITY_DN2434_c0_g1_i10:11-979(-)
MICECHMSNTPRVALCYQRNLVFMSGMIAQTTPTVHEVNVGYFDPSIRTMDDLTNSGIPHKKCTTYDFDDAPECICVFYMDRKNRKLVMIGNFRTRLHQDEIFKWSFEQDVLMIGNQLFHVFDITEEELELNPKARRHRKPGMYIVDKSQVFNVFQSAHVNQTQLMLVNNKDHVVFDGIDLLALPELFQSGGFGHRNQFDIHLVANSRRVIIVAPDDIYCLDFTNHQFNVIARHKTLLESPFHKSTHGKYRNGRVSEQYLMYEYDGVLHVCNFAKSSAKSPPIVPNDADITSPEFWVFFIVEITEKNSKICFDDCALIPFNV